MLDGKWHGGRTETAFGAFYDSTLDRYADAALPWIAGNAR